MKFHFNLNDPEIEKKTIITPRLSVAGSDLDIHLNDQLVAWFEEVDGKLRLMLADGLQCSKLADYLHLNQDGEIETE